MGTWGPAIFSDDLAADVRENFRALIGEGLTPEEATAQLEDEYAESVDDADEGPVFLLALAATQWKTGHVVPPVIERALAAIEDGRGMERWEETSPRDQQARRRALDTLAEQLRTPPRSAVHIPRRRLQETPLELGDVVAVPRGDGRLFFAVVDFHVDKGGRATVVRLLPFLDELPDGLEAHLDGQEHFIAFNDGRRPARPPDFVEVVAHVDVEPPELSPGGLVTWWSEIAEAAEPALRRIGLT